MDDDGERWRTEGPKEEEVGCEGQARILKEGRKRFFLSFFVFGAGLTAPRRPPQQGHNVQGTRPPPSARGMPLGEPALLFMVHNANM